LLAPVAIEYASQAMALHGTLSAAPGSAPAPGFLASVRSVNLHVARLDTVPGALRISATQAGGRHRPGAVRLHAARRNRRAAGGRPRHRDPQRLPSERPT
jgi:predicted hotdog family 3-hydroxylacyl-ACP dehydratase